MNYLHVKFNTVSEANINNGRCLWVYRKLLGYDDLDIRCFEFTTLTAHKK